MIFPSTAIDRVHRLPLFLGAEVQDFRPHRAQAGSNSQFRGAKVNMRANSLLLRFPSSDPVRAIWNRNWGQSRANFRNISTKMWTVSSGMGCYVLVRTGIAYE